MVWFKHYSNMAKDANLFIAAKASEKNIVDVYSIWMAILEHACGNDGSIEEFNPQYFDTFFSFEEGTVKAICEGLKAIGYITENTVCDWQKYESTDAKNAKRQRRWRENVKARSKKEKKNG